MATDLKEPTPESSNLLLRFFRTIHEVFNLRKDSDEAGTVENIRKNVDFHGANAWTLVFAIFIASIGLNVNSTAVVIGAMLISPLMGPILGVGLALGINDETLLKRSIRNMSTAVIISITTSMIYFLISPISEVQSELLARTSPTFYDVLIALCGGAAGIVSISRRERGPSVAGVAIATALMPPLCTAGFALSTGNLKFLAGALYLFVINSVFIALSTLFFVRYMKFQIVEWQDRDDRIKLRRWIGIVVVTVVLPSLFFAWSLLQKSRFNLHAERFIRAEFHSPTTFVVDKDLTYRYSKPVISIRLVGKPLSEAQVKDLSAKLPLYNLAGAVLEVHQLQADEASPATSPAEAELAALRQKVMDQTQQRELIEQISQEVKPLFPEVLKVGEVDGQLVVVWRRRQKTAEITKLNSFFAVRTGIKTPPLHVQTML